jgi:ADP-ribose pyrophosphatase YjhB (NUDIX family)
MASTPIEDLPEILPYDGDAYHGVQIDAAALFGGGGESSENEKEKKIDPSQFSERLRSSLGHWRAAGRRGVWLKLPLPQASCLFAVAVEEGFEPHHAEKDYVMMTQWLPGPPEKSSSDPSSKAAGAEATTTTTTTAAGDADDDTKKNPKKKKGQKTNNNIYSKLPSYASHQVGVGAFVLNSKSEVLVVQEASGPLKGKGVWKMPTGLADAGEDAPHAAAREVLEETGLRVVPTAVLAVRQAHGFAFGRSDLFFVVALKPDDEGAQEAASDSSKLVPQLEEVCAARWMPLAEYCSMPWLQSRPLWAQVAKACEAHAKGEYRGMPLRWLENGHNGRSDLLVCGWSEEEGEGEGEGEKEKE